MVFSKLHFNNKYSKRNSRQIGSQSFVDDLTGRQASTSRQAGFTLVEVMIATGLSAFLALAVSSILIFSVEQFDTLVQQHKMEERVLWASYHLRSYLSQAVNTHRIGSSCRIEQSNIGTLQDQGFIIEQYPCASPSSSADLIAIFPRENSFKFRTVDLFHTAIFYRRPDGPDPGVLSIGVGGRTGMGYFHAFESPDNIIYRGLSAFEAMVLSEDADDICRRQGSIVTCSSQPMAKTARFTLRFRYFLFADGAGGVRHDYTANIREINARELTSVIDVNFHNNTITKCEHMITGCDPDVNPTGKERIFGSIYFYKVVVPPGLFKL